MEEVTRLSTQKNVTVFTGKIKVGPIYPTFIRGDPYETQKPEEKLLFQTISWSGSRHQKVVNPFAWCQSWSDMRLQLKFEPTTPQLP